MGQITINTTTAGTPPFNIYVCNVYGNFCTLLATLPVGVPPIVTLPLPPSFDAYPAVGVKIIDSKCCEKFIVNNCGQNPCIPVNYYYSAYTDGGSLFIWCYSDAGGTTPVNNPCDLSVNVDYVDTSGPTSSYVITFPAGSDQINNDPMGMPPYTYICINSLTPTSTCNCVTLNNLTPCGV
jgi:hypothetical protein